MESFFIRYRNLVVLLAFLVAQIAGLAVQVRRTSSGSSTLGASDPGSVRLIRLWANAIIAPPERLIHASKMGVVGVWTNYFYLIHVRRQNQDLEKTIDRMRLEQAALLEDARQGQRLQALPASSKSTSTPPLPRKSTAPAAATARTFFISTRAPATASLRIWR